MKCMLMPGLVTLVLVLAAGVFAYFSPGQMETMALLQKTRLEMPEWKNKEFREALVDLQRKIRESDPRLRRFRLVNTEHGKAMPPPSRWRISLPGGTYCAADYLDLIMRWTGKVRAYRDGWVNFYDLYELPESNPGYLKRYLWPESLHSVDEE